MLIIRGPNYREKKALCEKSTVFIVDDEAFVRESLAALVQSMGIAHESFDSAEEFLAAYSPNRPGCVVTDVRMMKMSGLDLLEKLVEMQSSLPVIVITGRASDRLAAKAMQAGAFTFLEKTCPQQDLQQAIEQALAKNVTLLKEKQ